MPAPGLARHQVIVELQKLAALVGMDTPMWAHGGTPDRLSHLARRFYWFSDGLMWRSGRFRHAAIVGARIVSIGGIPIDSVVTRLRPSQP